MVEGWWRTRERWKGAASAWAPLGPRIREAGGRRVSIARIPPSRRKVPFTLRSINRNFQTNTPTIIIMTIKIIKNTIGENYLKA